MNDAADRANRRPGRSLDADDTVTAVRRHELANSNCYRVNFDNALDCGPAVRIITANRHPRFVSQRTGAAWLGVIPKGSH
jgi:hypothetical protein